jgi:hydroxymethylbilane synthase
MTRRTITIATRGSELALWQANHVRDALRAQRPEWTVELLVIKTQGDKILDQPLAKIGGKALFVKEIEQALLDDAADIAVHSMKDVPAELAPALRLAAVSTREDPADALCIGAGAGTGLLDLPRGARVGTSSLRRQCQLLAVRPDLDICLLRGNVPTRLAKLDAGEYHAVVLAAAGLKRLGHGERITQTLSPEPCLPAVGQGVLGIETRERDAELIEVLRAAIHDPAEEPRVLAERAFLAHLGGSCQTPLAAHATYGASGELVVDGMCGQPDGARILRAQRRGVAGEAEDLGRALAEDLLAQGAQAIIDACTRS